MKKKMSKRYKKLIELSDNKKDSLLEDVIKKVKTINSWISRGK